VPNDFSSDGSCKALWRYESGALTTDSIGSNTLTSSGSPTANTTSFKEGSACVDLEASTPDYFSITDANLDTSFPLKNGDTTKEISICYWIRFETLPLDVHPFFWLVNFFKGGTTTKSFAVGSYVDGGVASFGMAIGYASGASWQKIHFGTVITTNNWYHVGITYKDSTKAYSIRVWDDNAGALLGGAEVTGTVANNINVENGPVYIGCAEYVVKQEYYDGFLDEMVIFNRILTSNEIDKVRDGTFGAASPAAPGEPAPSLIRLLSKPLTPCPPSVPKERIAYDELRVWLEMHLRSHYRDIFDLYKNTGLGNFTPGSIIFADSYGSLGEDNTNLFWDDTNNRAGIGVNSSLVRNLNIVDTANPQIRIANTLATKYVDFEADTAGYLSVATASGQVIHFDDTLFNSLIGTDAGLDLTTGGKNYLAGYQAGYNYTTGHDSVAIGYQAAYDSSSQATTYDNNVHIGWQAGYYDPGDSNTCVGHAAGQYMDSSGSQNGIYCVYMGDRAGEGDIGTKNSGYQCVGIGAISLDAQTSGNYNTCVGYASGHGIFTGANNTYIGWWSGGGASGSNNTGVGYQACDGADGNGSVGIGYQAFRAGTSDECTFVGTFAGYDGSLTGNYNTAIGARAAFDLTTGTDNFYGGRYAGYRNETGSYNTGIGTESLGGKTASQQSNSDNLCAGYRSGAYLTTGSENVFLGFKSGYNQTTASNRFILDNQDRTDAWGHEAYKSFFYGTFAATSGAQNLDINADVLIRNDSTLASESLNEVDFATHAKWDTVGDFDDTGGNAQYTHSAGSGTLTQTSANMAVAGVGSRWYVFTYTITGKTYAPAATITTAFTASAVTLDLTNGTHTVYFQATASPGNFIISATSANGGFTMDDFTLKQLTGGDLTVNGDLNVHGGGGTGGTFTDLTVTNCCVLGSDSALFQPNADSTTFFQVKNAAGALVLTGDSTNRQVTIDYTSATYPFLINSTDASNQIQLYHDNTDAYMKWNDGNLYLQTDEGTNTDTNVRIQGKGSGRGLFRVYNQTDDGWVTFQPSTSRGYITIGGTVTHLALNHMGGSIRCFVESTEGTTSEFRVYGFRTGDLLRDLQIGVGVDAADTASFDGLSNYWFNGAIESEFTAPYLTLHNSTHEDTDGGRKSRLNFKGEQSGGEETTLARIEVGHDGVADDQKGKVVISVNTGANGDTPTQALEIGSDLLATFGGDVYITGDLSVGIDSPSSALHIKASTSGTVGSHPAGQLIIQNPTQSVWANAVITGYSSDGDGNPDQQLWYLGSSSGSNSHITFLNRRNSNLTFGTNNSTRMTILGNGDVGIGTTPDADMK